MKKLSLILFMVLNLTILSAGCKVKEPKESQLKIEDLTIEDYFPIGKNSKMHYIGVNSKFSEKTIYVEFFGDNRIQLKTRYPNYSQVRVLEIENGELKEIYSGDEFYHRENMLDVNNEMSNILLKEPLRVGNSWTTIDGYKRAITGVDGDIDTPYGKLKALEVTTQFGEGIRQTDYYVKDLGYVGTIYMENGFEIKTLLEGVDKKPLKTSIRFYYPLITDISTVYVDKEIEIEANIDIMDILEYNMKNPGHRDLSPSISKDTNINSIEFNREEEIARVDFSQELITDMDEDSSIEIEILKSIVNTIGNYYNVENVYISIDGEPYSSDYFSLREDEFFSVDYIGIEQFNK